MSRLVARVAAVAIQRRFDPAQAKGLEATIALRIRFRGQTLGLAIAIAGGACTVRPGSAPTAGAGATMGLADLVRLGLGRAGWPQLLSSGRLELSGDPFLAMRLPALFRMPVSRARRRPSRRRRSATARS